MSDKFADAAAKARELKAAKKSKAKSKKSNTPVAHKQIAPSVNTKGNLPRTISRAKKG
jgi:hypothetical protein